MGSSSKIYQRQTNSFIRFIIVGVLNTLVGLSIMFFSIHMLELSYWSSTFVGNASGAVLSFFLNRVFTFESNVSIGKGAIRFTVVIFVCYFLSYFLSDRFADAFPFREGIQKDFAILLGAAFYTISNYLGQKYFVFRKNMIPC